MIYKCPKCKGKGYYWDKDQLLLTGVFTAGLLPLLYSLLPPGDANMYRKDCYICDGEGIIK